MPSQSGNGEYKVTINGKSKCACPDFVERQKDCKHIHAVKLFLGLKEKVVKDLMNKEKPCCPYCKGLNIIRFGRRYCKDRLLATDTPHATEFRSLVEADVLGYENPALIIEGAIEHEASPDTNEMTIDFLKQFARLKFDGTKGDVSAKGAIKVSSPICFGVSPLEIIA